ncbi:MAG: hypothetical protein AAGI11_17010 [Pseudomonadota bacterium]
MRRLLALFAGVFASSTFATEFCLQAQHLIADTALNPEVAVHTDYESFVESKASIEPFQIHQYLSNPQGKDQMSTVISCKLKSAESLNLAFDPDGQSPVAGEDHGCERITQNHLNYALAKWGGSEADFEVVPEVQTYMGPSWLDDWPYQAARKTDDGRWQLHSRALRVVDAWYIPLPASIKGVHYCHLVAPDYLEALVKASAQQ